MANESDTQAEVRRLQARIAELEGCRAGADSGDATRSDDLHELYRTAPVGLCLVDTELRYVHVNELLARMNGKTVAEHIGRTLYEVIPGVAELIAPIFRRVLETGETITSAQVEANTPGTPYDKHTYLVTYQPFWGRDGRIAGVSTVIEDATELKRTERQLRTTVRELDHRVKNTLSTVQSLADQTARTSESLDEFMRAYRGRVDALARMHAPLTGAAAGRMSLFELVSLVVSPLCAAPDRVATEGDDLMVSTESIRPLGLTLHELATNAIKFGALSTDGGHVTVTSRAEHGGSSPRARITWVETNGPEVVPSSRRGFGTALITETLPYELGATVQLELPASGTRCEISLPFGNGEV